MDHMMCKVDHMMQYGNNSVAYDTSHMIIVLLWIRYLGRLDDELDELVGQQGLPHQKGHRHASREDQIRSTMLHERHLLEGPGFGEYCMQCIMYSHSLCTYRGSRFD